MIKQFTLLVCASALISGCIGFVRESEYDRNMGELTRQLKIERAASASMAADYEHKLLDKSRTLTVLTERYMEMQKENENLQIWKGGFTRELETLAKDVAELKLVITKNLDNTSAFPITPLLMKVIDMEYRLNELRKKQDGEGER